eukprot:scaffold80688_cov54-Phaeocystis_antarctica.AAC.1
MFNVVPPFTSRRHSAVQPRPVCAGVPRPPFPAPLVCELVAVHHQPQHVPIQQRRARLPAALQQERQLAAGPRELHRVPARCVHRQRARARASSLEAHVLGRDARVTHIEAASPQNQLLCTRWEVNLV